MVSPRWSSSCTELKKCSRIGAPQSEARSLAHSSQSNGHAERTIRMAWRRLICWRSRSNTRLRGGTPKPPQCPTRSNSEVPVLRIVWRGGDPGGKVWVKDKFLFIQEVVPTDRSREWVRHLVPDGSMQGGFRGDEADPMVGARERRVLIVLVVVIAMQATATATVLSSGSLFPSLCPSQCFLPCFFVCRRSVPLRASCGAFPSVPVPLRVPLLVSVSVCRCPEGSVLCRHVAPCFFGAVLFVITQWGL